jgi:hypothetical protein
MARSGGASLPQLTRDLRAEFQHPVPHRVIGDPKVIAAKLTAVREENIRLLLINCDGLGYLGSFRGSPAGTSTPAPAAPS